MSNTVAVGRWSFTHVPPGWEAIPDQGVRRAGEGVFPSNVVVAADDLDDEMTLTRYVENQRAALAEVLAEPHFDGPTPGTFRDADEAILLLVRHVAGEDVPVIQRQTYVRRGRSVAAVTATTRADEWPALEPVFDAIVAGLAPHD